LVLSRLGRKTLSICAMTLLCGILCPVAQSQSPKAVFKLEGLSPSFWNLIDHNAQLATVASGFGFTEGPVWDKAGYLWVSDEVTNQLFRVTLPDGKKQEVMALGDPDGNTYDKQQRLLDKIYESLADHYQGKRLNSPNDVVLGPDGAIYFTDPISDLPAGQKQEIPFKGVYRISKDGQVQLLTKDLTEPNGLAFSADGKKLYVDDSTQRNIRVYDFQSDGTLANGRIFGDEAAGPKDGVPDGMKVDTEGNLYVVGPHGIWVWNPQGVHVGTIVVPEQPANLAWGDADYSTLYITAETSVYKIRTKAHGFVPYL
jgi:gluconolactonase